MKFYTSYFYMIRHMEQHLLPISTARFDPQWFHDFKGASHDFLDKRGVVNGIRASFLTPRQETFGLCPGTISCTAISDSCDFKEAYRRYLYSLNFTAFLKTLEVTFESIRSKYCLACDFIPVLLVHEAPGNQCSERGVLQEWIRCNGMEVEEYKSSCEFPTTSVTREEQSDV